MSNIVPSVLCAAIGTGCTRSNTDAPAVAPQHVSAPSLPSWFGAPDAPHRRISGKLFGDRVPLAGTVHLRIDVPDPTIWSGMERVVGADGRFDFGAVRPGRYSLLASSPGRTSRLIAVDTRTDAADVLEIHAYPCRPSTRRILSKTGQPVVRATIDVGGVVVATTDHLGRYTSCVSEELLASREPMLVTVRAREHAATLVPVRRDPDDVVLDDAIAIRGTITDEAGAPLRDVAVQPVHVDSPTSHSTYPPVPLQGVTNAAGRFEIKNVPRSWGPYYLRMITGSRTFMNRATRFVAERAWSPVAAARPVGGGASSSKLHLSMSEFVEEDVGMSNARISGRVLHRGRPVPDTAVVEMQPNGCGYSARAATRSRLDGSFELPVVTEDIVTLLVLHRRGQELMRNIDLAPGQHLRDVTIEMPDEEAHER